MSKISDLKSALHQLKIDGDAYVLKADEAQARVKENPSRENIKAAARALKDSFMVDGGELIGVTEVIGARYHASAYEFKVDDGITRGSRLSSPNAYPALVKEGFKSIVDLTLEGTGDANYAEKAGLKTLNVKILDNGTPTNEQMTQFLDYVSAPENRPAYVHCEQGKGRTGVAIAAYRMAIEGKSVDEALEEAKRFGTSMPNQIDFIKSFGAALAAGEIKGYPLGD